MHNSRRARVLITHWVHPEAVALLEQHSHVIANATRESWPREVVLRIAAECDAVMAFMPDRIDDAFLAACPRLKIVAALLKAPEDCDVEACTRRGIWCSFVPDLSTVPTAELAIGLMIGLGRRVLQGDDHVRSGGFAGWRPILYGTGMSGRTLGVIGMQALGRAVAERAMAFGMNVLCADSSEDTAPYLRVSLDELLARSDYVLPLAPLSAASRRIIDATALAKMKRGALLVNVGRGGLVDEAAVAASLAAFHLDGYAADVFEMEDLAPAAGSRRIPAALVRERNRTLFTPHLGPAVEEARLVIAMDAAWDILEALHGRRPGNAVNEPRPEAVPPSAPAWLQAKTSPHRFDGSGRVAL